MTERTIIHCIIGVIAIAVPIILLLVDVRHIIQLISIVALVAVSVGAGALIYLSLSSLYDKLRGKDGD